jgi:hypothetical protein
MGRRQTSQALAVAEHVEPPNTPSYDRLKTEDLVRMLQLHKAGLTQTAIAQELGCTQPNVSQWLAKFKDSTNEASLYLKGQALHMAKNIVQNGLARDHVAALKGIKVLEESDLGKGINITVNGLAMVGLPSLSPKSEIVEGESLQIPEQSE